MASPLRIAIVGGGNIGSSFALKLATVGKHDVTVIARPGSKRLAQLQQNGIVTTRGENCKVTVADALNETVPYDVAIITTLGFQAEPLLPLLEKCAAKKILFMFCVYNPERLRDMFGERATFGMPFVQALLNDDGLLDATFKMQTVIGDQRWVDVFTSAGIPAVFDSEMLLWLRCHVGFSIAMLGVCVPAKRRGEGATWKEASTAAAGMYANFALTKSMGYRLHPAPKAIANSLPSTVVTGLLWLLSRQEGIRNLLGQARPECNALIDSVIEAAQKANKVSVIAPLQAVQSL